MGRAAYKGGYKMGKELRVSYTATDEEILLPKRDALLGMAMAELDKTDVDGEVVDRALDWSWALLDLKEEHRHMYTHLAIVAAEVGIRSCQHPARELLRSARSIAQTGIGLSAWSNRGSWPRRTIGRRGGICETGMRSAWWRGCLTMRISYRRLKKSRICNP